MKLVGVIFSLLLCQLSFAGSKDTKYRIKCDRPIKKAIRLGWKNIGSVDLLKLSQQIGSGEVEVLKGPKGLHGILGNRSHAQYKTVNGKGYVVFNHPKITKLSKKEAEKLCVHEMLGAYQYADQDFTFSNIINFIGEKKIRPGQSPGLDRFIKDLKTDYDGDLKGTVNSGDGGIVTGGGDTRFIKLKNSAFEMLFNSYMAGEYSEEDFSELSIGIQGCGLDFFRADETYSEKTAIVGGWDYRSRPASHYMGYLHYSLEMVNKIQFSHYPSTIFFEYGNWLTLTEQQQSELYLETLKTYLASGYNCKRIKRKNLAELGRFKLLRGGNDPYFEWKHSCLLKYPDRQNIDKRFECIDKLREKRLKRYY